MPYPPTPPSEPPPEAPVTPPYGSPLPPGFYIGRAAPQYPPPAPAETPYPQTAQFPVVTAPPPYPPPRRGRGRLLVGIAAAVIIAVLLCIGGAILAVSLGRDGADTAAPSAPTPTPEREPAEEASPTPPPAPTDHVVVYEVTGDGPANITYVKSAKGGTEQLGRADLPFRVEINMGPDAFVATVLALRVGASQGALTCRLLVDGVEVSSRTSEGRFAAATCAHLVLG